QNVVGWPRSQLANSRRGRTDKALAGGLPLRRSLALLVSAVVITLLGGAGAFAPASSGQSPGSTPPPCKPVSKPPRKAVAKAITVYASPNPLTAGRQVRVFGQLVGFRRGVKRCGIAIVLWRRFPGQRNYSPVGHTRTVADGRYSFLIPAR